MTAVARNVCIAGMALAAAASIVACDGALPTGNPGSGGASGSGSSPAGTSGGSPAGSSGGQSAGSSGGSPAGSSGGQSAGSSGGSPAGTGGGSSRPPVPGCLADLIAPCPLGGACTFSDASGMATRYCLASGTKVSAETITLCGADNTATPLGTSRQTVRKPDGSVCYTVERSCYCLAACEAGTITWKDADGDVVATATTNTSMTTVTCTGGGATAKCDEPWLPSSGCFDWPEGVVGSRGALSSCTAGTCQ